LREARVQFDFQRRAVLAAQNGGGKARIGS